MVIEYIGEIIRTELAETREKQYEARVIINITEKYFILIEDNIWLLLTS